MKKVNNIEYDGNCTHSKVLKNFYGCTTKRIEELSDHRRYIGAFDMYVTQIWKFLMKCDH